MSRTWLLIALILLLLTASSERSSILAEPAVPETVRALWSDFDPSKEPLDTIVVKEWEDDGIIYRYVTFHIGIFKGKPAQMAAFFGFPKGATKLPGLLHLHV